MESEKYRKEMARCLKGIYEENGIWRFVQEENTGSRFSGEVQDELFGTEDTSWWFKYRADVIHHLTERYLHKEMPIFDVGGGNGYTSRHMQDRGYAVILLEPALEACRNARKRGVQAVACGALGQENVRDHSVRQVFLLDVLEHIEDDEGFLRLMRQKLDRGGRVLLTVPAFQVLWSSEDDAAGHFRRYTLGQIKRAAGDTGFSVLYANYFFGFLFLPILIFRAGMEKVGLLKRREERSVDERKRITEKQFKERKGIIQMVLGRLEAAELRRAVKGKKVWFGSSILCVLEKGQPADAAGKKRLRGKDLYE